MSIWSLALDHFYLLTYMYIVYATLTTWNVPSMQDSVSGCRYIATQGPLRHTYADFWRMVLEFDIHVIAMVTKTSDSYGVC